MFFSLSVQWPEATVVVHPDRQIAVLPLVYIVAMLPKCLDWPGRWTPSSADDSHIIPILGSELVFWQQFYEKNLGLLCVWTDGRLNICTFDVFLSGERRIAG